MSTATEVNPLYALSSQLCEVFSRGKRELMRREGKDEVFMICSTINREEQAAVAFHLLTILGESIENSPCPASSNQLLGVQDSLSAISEFPNSNTV